ncbi:hypothetical protein [Demequina lutea]|uniref:Tetratricopeptide repeat-containing protein n=1 Tax=Demequina lutea TaxID=431489 RepID=A0A7Y9ZC42_9MICO|nr:hypothetical protein [Demequina lutea]NYI42642.1 hypothetical protein [Demequina lutea]
MTIEQTRDEVERLRARVASDPRAHELALADQLNLLSIDLAMRGDYDASAKVTIEALKVIAAHIDPLLLPPAEEFRYAGIVVGLASGLLIDDRADDAAGLLDYTIEVHARLAHLAGDAIVQPTFGPPPPPPNPEEQAQQERFRLEMDSLPPRVSPYTDDKPPVPFETPSGAFSRPGRGWRQPADWSFVHWQLLCARARAFAALGEKERALDDAVEALAINLLGTELDYARMVSSADAALKTASLLVEGVEPEEGPLGW